MMPPLTTASITMFNCAGGTTSPVFIHWSGSTTWTQPTDSYLSAMLTRPTWCYKHLQALQPHQSGISTGLRTSSSLWQDVFFGFQLTTTWMDFASVEDTTVADSGFRCFDRLFGTLGLQMKPKKALKPASKQKLLGVIIEVTSTHVILQPCPQRVARLLEQLSLILTEATLPPTTAQKLAGKLVFLQSTCFSQVGRALLGPLYARAHATQKQCEAEGLNGPLQSSLRSLIHLLHHLPPRRISLSGSHPTVSLYTDAFFQLVTRRCSLSMMRYRETGNLPKHNGPPMVGASS